jgi:hypothetical protein
LFIRKAGDIRAFLEKTLPVLMDVRRTGFGSFAVDIRWLSPRIVVEWRKEIWCVSREGRMWNTGDENLRFSGLRVPRKPLWRIASLPESGDDETPPAGVFPSIVPLRPIDEFLSAFGGEAWFEGVREISLERRAGSDLFRLFLVRGKQEFTLLIQRDKYERESLRKALRDIMDSLSSEGGSHFIDATYSKKIVVRDLFRLSTGAAEGSSK